MDVIYWEMEYVEPLDLVQAERWCDYKARNPSRLGLIRPSIGPLTSPYLELILSKCRCLQGACAPFLHGRRTGVEPRRRDLDPTHGQVIKVRFHSIPRYLDVHLLVFLCFPGFPI